MWVQPFRTANVELVPPRPEADRKVAVLLNPNARKVTPRVIRSLSHVVGEGDLFLSRSELDARRISQQVVDRGYDTVFLGGGDGTLACFVNEISNQVTLRRHHHFTPMPRFGMLKLGTGNSVASLVRASPTRGDGIVDDVLRARSGEVPGYRQLDLLLIDGKKAPFAGLGLDGKLLNDYVWVKRALGQGMLKGLLSGAAGYFASVAFKTAPYYLANHASVECEVVNGKAGVAYKMGPDGKPVGEPIPPGGLMYRGPLVMAAAGTVPFYGFELRMFPFAGKRRGMMHLRLGDVPATAILSNLGGLWKGTWFHEGMFDFLASDVHISFSREMPLQVAGDAEGYRDQLDIGMAAEPIEVVDFNGSLH